MIYSVWGAAKKIHFPGHKAEFKFNPPYLCNVYTYLPDLSVIYQLKLLVILDFLPLPDSSSVGLVPCPVRDPHHLWSDRSPASPVWRWCTAGWCWWARSRSEPRCPRVSWGWSCWWSPPSDHSACCPALPARTQHLLFSTWAWCQPNHCMINIIFSDTDSTSISSLSTLILASSINALASSSSLSAASLSASALWNVFWFALSQVGLYVALGPLATLKKKRFLKRENQKFLSFLTVEGWWMLLLFRSHNSCEAEHWQGHSWSCSWWPWSWCWSKCSWCWSVLLELTWSMFSRSEVTGMFGQ